MEELKFIFFKSLRRAALKKKFLYLRMDAARKAFGERIVIEETPYVCKNGKNNDPEKDFCHVYRIPLDLSGKRLTLKMRVTGTTRS